MRFRWRYLLVVVALAAGSLLVVACEEACEEEAPTGTPTAAVTGTPKATVTGTLAAATATRTVVATATPTIAPTTPPTAEVAVTPTTAPTTPPTAEVTVTPTPVVFGPGITDTEIILGADAPLSGAMGAVYATIPQATEAYFKYVNDTQGGVCGRKIVYKVEDNQDDPGKGRQVVRKLVEEDKVFAIVGALGDSPHPATWDYLNENGVPDILVSVGAHMFGADPEGHPWTVQMIASNRNEALSFGQYISQNLPGKKVAVLIPNIIQGTDFLEGMKEGLDPDKNEIVSVQSFEMTAVSIGSQVAKMKKDGAEVVTTVAAPGFSAQAIKEAGRLGWHPQWILSYINADEMMFQFVWPPELMDGVISFQALKLATWTDEPAVAEHHRIMREYDGPSPTNFTVYAQTLAEVAVEALSRTCDDLTRQGLMDAVESIKDWHSDLFLDDVNISFSDTDHRAFETGHMLRAVVENGKGRWEYFGPLWVLESE
jgi:branched-chain amino acid transport system substrate-binding protein